MGKAHEPLQEVEIPHMPRGVPYDPISRPMLGYELVRANLRRLREEPGTRRWSTGEVDTLGRLTWERIAERYEDAGGPPVSPETLRTDWFGTRREVRRYGWEQLIHLAEALDVSLFEIILPTEEEDLHMGRVSGMANTDDLPDPHGVGMMHASTVFRMPVSALQDQARRSWALEVYREDILRYVIQQHPWIANLKDERDKAMADGIPLETAYEVWFNQLRQKTDALTNAVRDKSSSTLDAVSITVQGAVHYGSSAKEHSAFCPPQIPRHVISREEAFTILRELGIPPKGAN